MFGISNLKLIAIAIGLVAAVGAVAYPAWKLGGAHVQADADKKVATAQATFEQMLMKQTQLTDTYRDLAKVGLADLGNKIDKIKIVNTTVTKNITTERASNPTYYEQSMPPGGIKQWDTARNLFR